VVSETTARKLWPDREAIGQVVQLDAYQPRGALKPDAQDAVPQLPFRAFTVVGVVRDVRIGLGIFEMADAGVYLPIGAESAGTSLTLRVREDPDRARQAIIGRLTRVDPAMGTITTLRALAGRGIYVLRIAFWVTAVLGGVALVLTVSGLFSVLSYMVEQRTQEIGVRMALGAAARKVVELVLSQSLLPVGFGLAAGAGLAAAGGTVLITRSAASQVADAVHVLDPLAYAVSIVFILTACMLAAFVPALRAARIDPMITLRRE
jgi:putative ABC transport system permease protein